MCKSRSSCIIYWNSYITKLPNTGFEIYKKKISESICLLMRSWLPRRIFPATCTENVRVRKGKIHQSWKSFAPLKRTSPYLASFQGVRHSYPIFLYLSSASQNSAFAKLRTKTAPKHSFTLIVFHIISCFLKFLRRLAYKLVTGF